MSLTVSQSVAPAEAGTASADESGLAYEMNTNPDPVRVSPATGALEKADIVVVGSHLGFNPIEIRRVTVGFPVGDLSHALTEHLKEIEATLNHAGTSWTASHNEAEQEIVFNAPGGATVVDPGQGVTIQLRNIPVNRQLGTVPLTVTASWRRAGTSASYKDDVDLLPVGKFPPDFRLDKLRAEPIALEHSGSTTLTWEASTGATYKLLYGTAEIDVTNVRTHTVNNLKQTTPFYLRGIAQSGNTTVERTLTTLVTVNVPDLEVTNLFVRGTLNTRRVSNLMHVTCTLADNGSIEWSAPVAVDLHSGANPPAMAVHNNRLYCVHRALIGDHLQWSASTDGVSWLPDQTMEIRSPDAPGLASLDGKLHCVYRAMDGTIGWTAFDGDRWSEPVPIAGTSTTHAPALAAFQGKLYCTYRTPDSKLFSTESNSAGAQWSTPSAVADWVDRAPDMTSGATSQGEAVISVALSPKDGKNWVNSYYKQGDRWSGSGVGRTKPVHGRAAAACYKQHVFYVYRDDDGYAYDYRKPDGQYGAVGTRPILTNLTKEACTLIVYQDLLHMFYMR
ncbi:hypothetical protein [Kitasatospora sp. NPDC017646]|uniref:hypothetical protein n=1 Tax=Kitasatospora sp. NPDC017646 TaxID=3364024 RepID=UPI0037AA087C